VDGISTWSVAVFSCYYSQRVKLTRWPIQQLTKRLHKNVTRRQANDSDNTRVVSHHDIVVGLPVQAATKEFVPSPCP